VSPPEENVWVEMASMRYPRSYFGTVVADGKIYAIGGLVSRGVGLVTGAVERYDPQTNTWMTLPSLPTPRYGGVAVCSMGKIY
jgi:N-acetylneuraminic acid mutarotase